MDHAFSFDQVKAFFTGLVSPERGPMIDFTAEQRQALQEAEVPVSARDPETQKEYVIVQREIFEKIQQVLDVEEIDRSFFEFEDLDYPVDSPRML